MLGRVLITGGSGLLGLNLAFDLWTRGDVVLGLHQKSLAIPGMAAHILSSDSSGDLSRQVAQIAPNLIIHAAALSSVDSCELYPERARFVNVDFSGRIARIATELGIKLVFISTDQLFSGGQKFLTEKETPRPINEYGRTKAMAEELVVGLCPDALIVRTNFFGWGYLDRVSLSDWVIHSLRDGKKIKVFRDVFFTPILIEDLGRAMVDLVQAGASGIFNVTGDERLSKQDFALRLAGAFELNSALLEPASVLDLARRAQRPLEMSLDNRKTREWLSRDLGSMDAFAARLRIQETRFRENASSIQLLS